MKKILFLMIGALAFSAAASKSSRLTHDDTGYCVDSLKANHAYVLCLNGYTDHESNKILLTIGECWERTGEGYIDYAVVYTDEYGRLKPTISDDLPSGSYKVKLLIKDPASQWEVVWNQDEVQFNVD